MCVLACVCGCALGMLVYEIFNFQTFITSDNDSIISNPFYTNVLSNVDDYDYHRLVIIISVECEYVCCYEIPYSSRTEEQCTQHFIVHVCECVIIGNDHLY